MTDDVPTEVVHTESSEVAFRRSAHALSACDRSSNEERRPGSSVPEWVSAPRQVG